MTNHPENFAKILEEHITNSVAPTQKHIIYKQRPW